MSETGRVRVAHNPVKTQRLRWLVHCEICTGDRGLLAAFMAQKWGAEDWRTAQDFATRHALVHEARRCPTCLHVPEGPIPEEARV